MKLIAPEALDLVSDLLIILDENHRIVRLNQAARLRLGFSETDLLGQSISLLVRPKINLDLPEAQITDLLDVNGKLVPVKLRTSRINHQNEFVTLLVAQDLSELNASQDLLRTAFENSGSLLSISRISDGIYLDVNPAFLETLGYTRQEVIGKTSNQLGLLADQTLRDYLVLETLRAKHLRDLDVRIKTKDGRFLDALFNVDLLMINGEPCVMTSATDITRRKQAEVQLVEMLKNLEVLVARKVDELNQAQLGTIIALSNITESRDTDTGHHIERISALAVILAKSLANDPTYEPILDDGYITTLANASVLHDIGKVGIPDAILLKPGKLTPDEFDIMKHHVNIGWSMLKKLSLRFPDNRYLQMGLEIILNHHERWDGKGYPNGVKGNQIPLAGQLIALCDVYDALRSRRPYKEPIDHQSAVDLIIAQRGSQFNPDVVDAFLGVEHHFESTYATLAE